MLWCTDSECLICLFASYITHSFSIRLWSFIYNTLHRSVLSFESPKSWEVDSRSLSSLSAKKSNPFWLSKWMTCFGPGFPWNVLGMSWSSDHPRETSIGKSHKRLDWKEEVGKDGPIFVSKVWEGFFPLYLCVRTSRLT